MEGIREVVDRASWGGDTMVVSGFGGLGGKGSGIRVFDWYV